MTRRDSFLTANNRHPMQKYHWRMLYIQETLKPVAKGSSIVHYMYDILIGHSNADHFKNLLAKITEVLLEKDYKQLLKKVQFQEPYTFLWHTINNNTLKSQRLQFKFPTPPTLSSMQTFLRNLTWVWPCLPITTGQLTPYCYTTFHLYGLGFYCCSSNSHCSNFPAKFCTYSSSSLKQYIKINNQSV